MSWRRVVCRSHGVSIEKELIDGPYCESVGMCRLHSGEASAYGAATTWSGGHETKAEGLLW